MEYQNPIVDGYYADPEVRFYEGKYYIYVTRSHTVYDRQLNLDVFSSADLQTWKKTESILAMEDFPYVDRAVWAPTIIERKGGYYLIFASNDIQNDEQYGGLEIAVSDKPEGPFHGYLGHPLIDRFVNQAQPIDAHFFQDDDGTVYLYWGGWKHCNVAVMNDTMDGFIPFHDGSWCRSVTPAGYVEGPCMIKKDSTYFFMWSEGDWVDGTYHVCYCASGSPFGPFENRTVILERQEGVAEGPGHHCCLFCENLNRWMIIYHRRFIGDKEAGHRVLCMDQMEFLGDRILPVVMTKDKVVLERRPVRP